MTVNPKTTPPPRPGLPAPTTNAAGSAGGDVTGPSGAENAVRFPTLSTRSPQRVRPSAPVDDDFECQRRWRDAVHEAGHAIVTIAVGGPPAGAVLFPGGGGLAFGSHCLAATPSAIVAAAGEAAEPLADRFPPPVDSQIEAEVAGTGIPLATPLPPAEMIQHQRPQNLPPNDEVQVAQWAIRGHERQPDAWAGRVRWLRFQADAHVRDNAPQILDVARRLYIAGRVTPEELTLLFPAAQPSHAAPAVASAAHPVGEKT